jgi:hypothetical protein
MDASDFSTVEVFEITLIETQISDIAVLEFQHFKLSFLNFSFQFMEISFTWNLNLSPNLNYLELMYLSFIFIFCYKEHSHVWNFHLY